MCIVKRRKLTILIKTLCAFFGSAADK